MNSSFDQHAVSQYLHSKATMKKVIFAFFFVSFHYSVQSQVNTQNQLLNQSVWTPIAFQNPSPRVRSVVNGKLPALSSGAITIEFRLKGGDGGTGTWDGLFVDKTAASGQGATVELRVSLSDYYNANITFYQGKAGESTTDKKIASGGGGGASGILFPGIFYRPAAVLNHVAVAGGGGGSCSIESLQSTGIAAGTHEGEAGKKSCSLSGKPSTFISDNSPSLSFSQNGINIEYGSGNGGHRYSQHVTILNSSEIFEFNNEIQGDGFREGGLGGYHPYRLYYPDGKTCVANNAANLFDGSCIDKTWELKDIARGGSGWSGGGAGGIYFTNFNLSTKCTEVIHNDGGAGGGGAGWNGFNPGGSLASRKIPLGNGGGGAVERGGGGGGSMVSTEEYVTEVSRMAGGTTNFPQNGYIEYRVIYDTSPPIAKCKSTTIPIANGSNYFKSPPQIAGEAHLALEMIDNGSSDEDGRPVTLTTIKEVFTCEDIGINNVWLYVTDLSGNIDSCLTTITIIDDTPPQVIPSGAVIDIGNRASYVVHKDDFTIFASDNCGSDVSIDFADDIGNGILEILDCSNLVGVHDYTFTATDASGNITTATASLTLTKSTPPLCRTKNHTITLVNGVASISIGDIDDNSNALNGCGATVTLDKTNFTCADAGEAIVHLTATDRWGNTSICPATVTVIDPTDRLLLYVDASATSGNNDGSSWTDAYITLTDAIAEATSLSNNPCQDGLVNIYVAQGIYYPDEGVGKINNDPTQEFFLVRAGIELYGGFNPSLGIDSLHERDWKQYQTILSGDIDKNDDVSIIRDASQIKGNNAHHVIVTGTFQGTIDGLIITAGRAVNSAGASHSSETQGAGLYISGGSNVTMRNCWIVGNHADGGGGAFRNDAPITVINSIISDNKTEKLNTGTGGAISYLSDVLLLNCTLSNNQARNGASFYSLGSGHLTARNTIFWDATTFVNSYYLGSFTAEHCIMRGAEINETNFVFNQDPLFTDPSNGDFSITNTSPARNAGNNQFLNQGVDYCLQDRTKACRIDIGAIEYQETSLVEVYVDQNATSMPLGTSWEFPFRHIEDALACSHVDVIHVAQGVYASSRNSISINRNVSIVGGYPTGGLGKRDWENNPTIITANLPNVTAFTGDYTTLKITDASPALDGIIIQGGYSDDGNLFFDPLSPAGSGGGVDINNGSPSFTNCIIRNNHSLTEGGAVLVLGSNSHPRFYNCLFHGNNGGQSSIYSGEGSIDLVSCTIADGLPSSLKNEGAFANVINTIAWPNGAMLGNAHVNYLNSLLSEASLPANASTSSATNFNIFASDPLYVGSGDYRLAQGSPAIDQGANGISGTPNVDLEGRNRNEPFTASSPPIDIGAYEFIQPRCEPTDIYYVDASVSGGDGLTWATAYDNIDKALNIACDGSQIWVAEGVYKALSNFFAFRASTAVKMYGGFVNGDTNLSDRDWNAHPTIISGDKNNNGQTDNFDLNTLLFIDADITLDGFILERALANSGGFAGIRGAGIINTANPIIRNTLFRFLEAESGGSGQGAGIYSISGNPTIEQCIFQNNNANDKGGALYLAAGQPKIVNCTFYDNTSPAGAIVTEGAKVDVINSVFYNNGIDLTDIGSGTFHVSHSSLEDASLPVGATGSNNIFSTDPLFLNPAGGDFNLSAFSPAQNIGDNSQIDQNTDFNRDPRIRALIVDAGALEKDGLETCFSDLTLYVDASAVGGLNTGLSWSDAFVHLQDALSLACEGVVILVAEGDYKPDLGVNQIDNDVTSRFVISDQVTLYGGFSIGGSIDRDPLHRPTILNGLLAPAIKAQTVVEIAAVRDVVLDGFYVQNGSALTEGGGMRISGIKSKLSVDIRNCVFADNTAVQHGGAIGIITTGLGAQDSVNIDNCLFYSNNAGFTGSAIANNHFGTLSESGSCALSITHSTFAKNQGNGTISSFGKANSLGPVSIKNSIISSNNTGLNISSFGGSLQYDHSLIQGLSDVSNGNFSGSIDPLWADPNTNDFSLQECSILIDQGDNDDISANDISTLPRLANANTDLGVIEYQDIVDTYITIEKEVLFCSGDTFYIKGQGYTSFETIVDTITTTLGCDSICITHLRSIDIPKTYISTPVCDTSLAGTFIDTLSTVMGCDSIINETRYFNIDTAYAGADVNLCGLSVQLDANTPSFNQGTWSIISGTSGTISDINDPVAIFQGTNGQTYIIEWAIDNGPCSLTRDTVIISTNQPPSVAQAGGDESLCSTTFSLNAFPLSSGTGLWTADPITGASFTNATSNTSMFTGMAGLTYTLTWTVTNGMCVDSDEKVVTLLSGGLTAADAGPDTIRVCDFNQVSLQGNFPPPNTFGGWSATPQTGSASFGFPDFFEFHQGHPNAIFEGELGHTYKLTWGFFGACPASTDFVIVIFDSIVVADAGVDQEICGTMVTLSANALPSGALGQWTIISGAGGSLGTDTSPTSSFVGTQGVIYELQWTVTTGSCTSMDIVKVMLSDDPTVSSAGPDQTTCATSTLLAANAPTAGQGQWSIITGDGNGNITDIDNPTTSFSGTAGFAYTLRWTIVSGSCIVSTDDVDITISGSPITLEAGASQDVCGTSTTLNATGTGSWTIVSGVGGSFGNSTSASSTFSGNVEEKYTLAWTSAGGCVASDHVIITFFSSPTANAGADQEICMLSTTLDATSVVIGTGSWSIISGAGGSISDVVDPQSAFTGTEGTEYTLRWTTTNSPCPIATDDIIITINDFLSLADAGPFEMHVCGASTSLNATAPTVGSGMWNVAGNNTGGSFNDPTSPSSTFSGNLNKIYFLTWTVSGNTCLPDKDTTFVYFHDPSEQAIAPDDITVCGTEVTLSGNNATLTSSGRWALISGTGGSLGFNGTANGIVLSGNAGTTYGVEWTITNGSCGTTRDTVNVILAGSGQTTDAGENRQVCGDVVILTAADPVGGTGLWSISAGGTGQFLDATDPNTYFQGNVNSTYFLKWTVDYGSCIANDIVNIFFGEEPIADGGSDISVCGTSTTLEAAPLLVGTWSIVSGDNGIIADVNNPMSGFSGDAGSSYQLEWTIDNGICDPVSDVITVSLDTMISNPSPVILTPCTSTITLDAPISAPVNGAWTIITGGFGTFNDSTFLSPDFTGVAGETYQVTYQSQTDCETYVYAITIDMSGLLPIATAGSDITTCDVTASLSANNPGGTTIGTWAITSGSDGTLSDINDPNATFTGTTGQNYTLTWTITDGVSCTSSDEMSISIGLSPSTADAGIDQNLCAVSTTLTASVPTTGTGVWSIIAGIGGSFSNTSSPTSSFTGSAGTTYHLQWTTSTMSICDASSDEVIISFGAAPSIASAGIDTSICGSIYVLAPSLPTSGIGTWSVISGTGSSFSDDTNPNALFTGIPGTTYNLDWTIDGGICGMSSDQVIITLDELPSIALAGSAGIVCGNDITLGANSPSIGNGKWSIISGNNGIIDDDAQTTSLFSGTEKENYLLEWAITNGVCATSSDVLFVQLLNQSTIAVAGSDQNICGTSTSLSGNQAIQGGGKWKILSGAGGVISDSTKHNSNFTGLAGNTYSLQWTLDNAGFCTTIDNVTISFNANPSPASAGGDQTSCGLSIDLEAITPSVGTGQWSIISGMGGTITDANMANSSFSGSAGTTYNLRWTNSNGICPSSSDDISITLLGTGQQAVAGMDQIVCGISLSLSANQATSGTGTWSILSGAGGSFSNTNSHQAVFTGQVDINYSLQWALDNNGVCESLDEINVRFDPLPVPPTSSISSMRICPDLKNIPIEVTPSVFTNSYNWNSSISGLGIQGNGSAQVLLDIPDDFTGGSISINAINSCGTSTPYIIALEVGTSEWCELADCLRENVYVDQELLDIEDAINVFKTNAIIQSNASINDRTLIFKAGNNIDMFPGFTVEQNSIFIAEIEKCMEE